MVLRLHLSERVNKRTNKQKIHWKQKGTYVDIGVSKEANS